MSSSTVLSRQCLPHWNPTHSGVLRRIAGAKLGDETVDVLCLPKITDFENMNTCDIDLTDVSSTMTADILGMTRQRVSQLRSAGVLQNNGKRGRYDLIETVPAYAAYLEGNGGADANTALVLERIKKLDIQNRIAENNLVRIQDATTIFAVAIQLFESAFAAAVDRMAKGVVAARTPTDVRETIDTEIARARAEIAEQLRIFCDVDSSPNCAHRRHIP